MAMYRVWWAIRGDRRLSVQEAAGAMLEETAEETATEGVSGVDVPGIDPVAQLKKMALSTTPNPPIGDVMAEEETDKGGAYLIRSWKKAMGGVGWGDGKFPAILDACIGLFYKGLNRGEDGTGIEVGQRGVEPE